MRRVSAYEIRLAHQCRSFADAQDDKKGKQDDRSGAQKFVTLSECEESPLMRSDSRINVDPSLTFRMTKKENRVTVQDDLDRGPRRSDLIA